MSSRAVVATGAGAGSDVQGALAGAMDRTGATLGDLPCDLAVLFVGAAYAEAAQDIAARVGERFSPGRLVGVTTNGVIVDDRELERPDALAIWAAALPGATAEPVRLGAPGDDVGGDWPDLPEASALVLFADPFTFPADGFLAWAAHVRPGLPISGGLASAAARPGGNRLLLDGAVHADGAVGVALGGDVRVRTVVSQGCRPVGRTWTVTAADRNLISALAGASPVDRIRETYVAADATDQALMRAGLHVGIVIDEYADEHGRGDFLVRGVLGAQPDSGAVAVGDVVRVGQTVQFHVRDARSADEDLRDLLRGVAHDPPAGTLLFSCNGRGARLFGTPDHDAGVVRDLLGAVPTAGFFCAGELGPVGPRSHLHGFTASMLLLD